MKHGLPVLDADGPDAEFPGAVDEFLEQIPDVGEADRRAVLWDTPLRFYRLEDRFSAPTAPTA